MTKPDQGVELVTITPDMAHDWLGFNTHNRPLRGRTVASYAADMAAGDWQWNGESVKFASDGTLLDGQHRLAAIVAAQASIPMLVIRGLPTDTQDTVDGGVKRRFSDVLSLRGETNCHQLAAIIRRVTVWEGGYRRVRGNDFVPTNAQMFQTLGKYPWLRETGKSAQAVALKCELPGSIIGFCMWLFSQIPDAEEDIEFFFARLADFQGLAKGDAIYELKSTLESSKTVRGARSEVFLTAITIKAWNAYRVGKPVGLLKFKTGGAHPEKFPEPL